MDQELVRLIRLLRGFALNQVIASAVRRDIPSLVAGTTRTGVELAALTGLPWQRLQPMLVILADLGIVQMEGDGYRGTPAAELLARGSGRLHGLALMSAESYYRAWAALDTSLDTGASAFEHVHGMSMWQYLDAHPDVSEQFAQTMGASADLAAQPILEAVEFPAHGTLVDVGGGNGSLVAAILEHHPGLHAQVLELPSQVRRANERLGGRGLDGRYRVVAGDMFTDIPAGADLYLFKGVFHNWPDEALTRMLTPFCAGLRSGARVVVVERAMSDGPMTVDQAINTLTMTLLFGSTDRTVEEYRALLTAQGLHTRIPDATDPRLDIIEATKE